MDQNLQDMEIGNTKEDVMTFDIDKQGYTQREWDRVVGWGKVPKEYSKPESKEDEQENRSVIEDTDD